MLSEWGAAAATTTPAPPFGISAAQCRFLQNPIDFRKIFMSEIIGI
jgi:hypothetical protein